MLFAKQMLKQYQPSWVQAFLLIFEFIKIGITKNEL
jgi:hypothetical protein